MLGALSIILMIALFALKLIGTNISWLQVSLPLSIYATLLFLFVGGYYLYGKAADRRQVTNYAKRRDSE